MKQAGSFPCSYEGRVWYSSGLKRGGRGLRGESGKRDRELLMGIVSVTLPLLSPALNRHMKRREAYEEEGVCSGMSLQGSRRAGRRYQVGLWRGKGAAELMCLRSTLQGALKT